MLFYSRFHRCAKCDFRLHAFILYGPKNYELLKSGKYTEANNTPEIITAKTAKINTAITANTQPIYSRHDK